jgi:hypothetical protein
MSNYTREKSKYGGCVGSIIIHTTPGLGLVNDPSSAQFRQKIPGGYLRCDGSILNSKDYLALSNLLGSGEATRFIKPGTTPREPDVAINDLGQFSLPDLGSKVIVGGRGTGIYNNYVVERETESNVITTRTGPQIAVTSNFGNQIESSYIGNVNVVAQSALQMVGNARFNVQQQTTETVLNIENFQGHAHRSNQKFLQYSAEHEVGAFGGKDRAQREGASGSGNSLDVSNDWDQGASTHSHRITRPFSYGGEFLYSYGNTNIDMSSVQVSLDVDVSDEEKLDELSTPFLLVEYLIKF